jgi:hypothetical protein
MEISFVIYFFAKMDIQRNKSRKINKELRVENITKLVNQVSKTITKHFKDHWYGHPSYVMSVQHVVGFIPTYSYGMSVQHVIGFCSIRRRHHRSLSSPHLYYQ